MLKVIVRRLSLSGRNQCFVKHSLHEAVITDHWATMYWHNVASSANVCIHYSVNLWLVLEELAIHARSHHWRLRIGGHQPDRRCLQALVLMQIESQLGQDMTLKEALEMGMISSICLALPGLRQTLYLATTVAVKCRVRRCCLFVCIANSV